MLDDLKEIAELQQLMTDSIGTQYTEKLQELNEVQEKVNTIQKQLQDAMNRGLKAQTKRLDAKLKAATDKLNSYKKTVEEWSNQQKHMIVNIIKEQTDKINQRAIDKLNSLNELTKSQQEEMAKKKAEAKANEKIDGLNEQIRIQKEGEDKKSETTI